MKIAIQNAKIVTYTDKSEVIENHTLIVKDDLISDIIPDTELSKNHPDAEIINASGKAKSSRVAEHIS